jgi:hypothetical protein
MRCRVALGRTDVSEETITYVIRVEKMSELSYCCLSHIDFLRSMPAQLFCPTLTSMRIIRPALNVPNLL